MTIVTESFKAFGALADEGHPSAASLVDGPRGVPACRFSSNTCSS